VKNGFKPRVSQALSSAGFAYKHKAWLRYKHGLCQVVSFSKTDYSEELYAECGVFVVECLGKDVPVWNKAHLRKGAEIPMQSKLESLLKDHQRFSDAEVVAILCEELITIVEEQFAKVDSIEKVRMVVAMGNPNKTASVNRTIMEWFGVPVPESKSTREIGVIRT